MTELSTPMPDQFELERPMQPKLAVADYVESQGILVPKRYKDMEEAQHAAQQGLYVLARSEHPDEYSGPSGLGTTGYFEPDNNGGYLPKFHEYKQDIARRYERYAWVSGVQSPQEYAAQLSESYWQVVPGTNITCIADDTVEGRYHIFGRHSMSKRYMSMYMGSIVNEDGSVVRSSGNTPDQIRFTKKHKDIIQFYNTVRRLGKFYDAHCPIIEMQLGATDDEYYFLQYHRTRDANPVSEVLNPSDFDARDKWVKAEAVRGSYLGERALKLALWYPGSKTKRLTVNDLELPEDGYNGMNSSFYDLDESVARQRIAHVMPSNFRKVYKQIATYHGPRSRMFKPQVSILTNPSAAYDHIPEDIQAQAAWVGSECNRWAGIETQVVSDGRTAYVKYGDELIIR